MFCIVFVTAGSMEEAQTISRKLLDEKLVACVNIIKDLNSFFWWKGKIDQAKEVMLVMKTKKTLVPGVVASVKKLHSYDVPEVIAFPTIDGNQDYLQWVDDSVTGE
jgi:periplasmic divalent cation tolerance protein